MTKVGHFFAALILGGLAGFTCGLLTAPKSGKDARKKLATTADKLYRKAAYELEELAQHSDELRAHMEKLEMPETARKAIVAIDEAIHDFTPGLSGPQRTINKAHDALAHHDETMVQSQQVLNETTIPAKPMSSVGESKVQQSPEDTANKK